MSQSQSQLGNAWGQPLPAGHAETKRVLDEVLAERLRQEQLRAAGKFLPDAEKLSVLAEEFGDLLLDLEAARALLADMQQARAKLRAELIQVAAVAVAWAEAIEP